MSKEDVVYVYTAPPTHTHTMECYLAIKKNEITPSVATWMDPEISILSDVSQKEKGRYLLLLICKISRKRYQ